MSERPDPILPGETLTVIIRDDGPMAVANDAPTYRSVRIKLTQEQREQLKLHQTWRSGGVFHHETISRCFIEPGEQER